MKKYIVLTILGMSIGLTTQAQDINDALRYSQTNINGTARFRAMGGAFSALGGDLSAISINPASSAVFINNQFGFTLSNYSLNNKSDYMGTKSSRTHNNFDLNQIGAVFVFENDDEESGWKKFTIGINYDSQNSHTNKTFSKGFNTTSIDQFFLNKANGVPLDLLQTMPGESARSLYTYLGENYGSSYQTAFLGYDTYILDAVNNNPQNTQYVSNVSQGTFEHYNYITQSGYNGKIAFNLAAQYDRFYFGLNLNGHMVDYTRMQTFYETNNNPINSSGETVREIQYQNELYTYGSGFSLQLGGIARITNEFRIGLSYESPTWYKLNDESMQRISTYRIDTSDPSSSLLNAYFDEGVVNIFPEYRLQSPSKYTIGGAYVFKNIGLISVDYSLKDYSGTKFRPTNDSHFSAQNNMMSDVLRVASEVRVGAETRVNQWSFRGGYNYQESPYTKNSAIGDLQQYSLGFGYDFGSTKLDMAYSRTQRESGQSLFDTGLTDAPKIETVTNNIFLTLLFEF